MVEGLRSGKIVIRRAGVSFIHHTPNSSVHPGKCYFVHLLCFHGQWQFVYDSMLGISIGERSEPTLSSELHNSLIHRCLCVQHTVMFYMTSNLTFLHKCTFQSRLRTHVK